MKETELALKALLLASLAGDSAAHRSFLKKASVLLRRFVGRRLLRMRRSAQDTEDIVQETLIAIHTKLNTYDGETPVTAWIYGIARYKLIDNLRTSNADTLVDLAEIDSAVEYDRQTEARLVVRKILSIMPATLRVPIELMKLQGLSASEAALETRTSEVTVRVNVHRGLKAFRRYCGVNRNVRDEDR